MKVFVFVLQKEEVDPVKMAVDRPSDKLLSFLNKHYGLGNAHKQTNNYVIFDGFFPKTMENELQPAVTENNNR